jgi:hypothetical protein
LAFTGLHGILFQKLELFTTTAVKTTDLTKDIMANEWKKGKTVKIHKRVKITLQVD